MTTPEVSLPALRAYLGSIACTATTSTSANRGLRSLEGALTESDTDVQNVVNALIDCVDALAVESAASTNGLATSQLVETIAHDAVSTGTEVAKTYTYSGATARVDLYEIEVTMITDDGLDAYVGRFVRAVNWSGTTLYAVGDSTAVFEIPSSGATSAAFEIYVTGATVQLKVTGSTDWKWAIAVHRTRRTF